MWAAWLSWAKGWVAGLVVAILLAGLVEMVLPEGETRRYVRLVTGLVVLLAVALPLLSLVRLGLGPSLGVVAPGAAASATSATQAATGAGTARTAGAALDQYNRRATLNLAQWGLERQVEGLALGTAGVGAARGRVALLDGEPPRVKWVFLQVWPAAAGPGPRPVTPVEPVTAVGAGRPGVGPEPEGGGGTAIGVSGPAVQEAGGEPEALEAAALSDRLRQAVARGLGVDPEQVRVQVEPAGTAPAAGSGAAGPG